MRVTRTLAVASAAAIAFAALVTSSPAQAEPSSWPVADVNLVAMGSDTIQFVADSFQTTYDATSPANPFISADATGTSPIQTKVDTGTSPCAGITRANGSSAGITQLAKWIGTNNKVSGQTYGYACVDLARSSRNLKTGDPNWLTSVLFARDLITWSSNSGGNGTTSLSDTPVNALKAIYQCNDTALGGSGTPVTWNEVGGTSTDAIVPVLPQAGSGTRSQWETDLGLTDATIGSCVVNGTFKGANIEENEGTNAVFTAAGWSGTTTPNAYKDIVFPYSGGDYLCESLTTNCSAQSVGSLTLRQIDGKSPTTGTGSATTLNIGTSSPFPATYIRGLYFVERNGCSQTAPCTPTPTSTGSQWPVDLTPFVGNGTAHPGWICSTAAQNIVTSFKFVSPGTQCGGFFNSTPTPSPAPPTP